MADVFHPPNGRMSAYELVESGHNKASVKSAWNALSEPDQAAHIEYRRAHWRRMTRQDGAVPFSDAEVTTALARDFEPLGADAVARAVDHRVIDVSSDDSDVVAPVTIEVSSDDSSDEESVASALPSDYARLNEWVKANISATEQYDDQASLFSAIAAKNYPGRLDDFDESTLRSVYNIYRLRHIQNASASFMDSCMHTC